MSSQLVDFEVRAHYAIPGIGTRTLVKQFTGYRPMKGESLRVEHNVLALQIIDITQNLHEAPPRLVVYAKISKLAYNVLRTSTGWTEEYPPS